MCPLNLLKIPIRILRDFEILRWGGGIVGT
jgi:hypothetical protein